MKKTFRKVVYGVLFLVVIFTVYFLWYPNDLEKAVISCKEHYSSNWKLDFVKEDVERKHIEVEFEYRHGEADKKISSIINTQKALTECLLLDENSPWRDYVVDIRFRNIAEAFAITNITRSQENLTVGVAELRVSLKEIAEQIPEAKILSFYDSVYYVSMEEIKGFSDLKEIDFGYELSEEEKEYILSLYPECVIK